MKYCLNNNQSYEYLQKADEIKILYQYRNKIIDYIEKYPNKTIILDKKNNWEIIDWEEIKRYNIMTQHNFIMALYDPSDITNCKKHGIKFYLNYPITTFYELQSLKDLGVEYALIDSPLVQDIVNAAAIGVPLRVVPNVAYYAFIPRDEGVCGSWIRPEDLYLYESYIAAIEFEDCDIKKEQALFRIYAEQKTWSGDLGMIITNLNYPGINRMIPTELTEKRMTCGQRCQSGGHCRLCYRYLELANPELIQGLKRNN